MGIYSSNYRYIYEVGKLVHEDKAGCGFKNYRIIENIVNLQAELDGNLLYKGYINKYEDKAECRFKNYREYIEFISRTG